jgi:outer membrane protein TolC
MFIHSIRKLVSKRRCSAALAAVLLFASAAATAQAPLVFEEALRLARERSRQLVAQDAAASAAREMAVSAGQLPDPTIKAGLNNVPVNGPDQFSLTRDFMTMRSVGLAQEFTREDKRKARAARFEREADAAAASRAAEVARLQRETALAWFERYYAERLREVLREQRAEENLQVEATDAAYRGGRGAQTEVFAARSAIALTDDRLRQVERQILTARTRLARWIGTAAEQPLGPPPSIDKVHLDAATVETQLEHHPDVATMLAQEAVAQAEADIAQANKRADWSVELMYSQRGPAYSNMISLNVSIPLQLGQKDRQERELLAKLRGVEQLRAQREEAVREHTADIRGWLQEWESNRGRLMHYDGTRIPLAAERTRAALTAYRGAGAPLGAVLEARRAELDVRTERIRLEMETAALWSQIEFLLPAGHPAGRPDRVAVAKEPR